MGNIRIVNMHSYVALPDEVLIKVDRTTPVGNPFPMDNQTQAERDRVCNQYNVYFGDKVKAKTDKAFMDALRSIYKAALKNDVALGCWCYPKRCHAETIKRFIESYLK